MFKVHTWLTIIKFFFQLFFHLSQLFSQLTIYRFSDTSNKQKEWVFNAKIHYIQLGTIGIPLELTIIIGLGTIYLDKTLPLFFSFYFARALFCLHTTLLCNFFNSITDNLVILFSNLSPIQRAFLSSITIGPRRNSLYRGGEYTFEQGRECCLLE